MVDFHKNLKIVGKELATHLYLIRLPIFAVLHIYSPLNIYYIQVNLPQFSSSFKFPQSLSPSQCHISEMHFPLPQSNQFAEHSVPVENTIKWEFLHILHGKS